MQFTFFPKQEEFINSAISFEPGEDGVFRNKKKVILYGGGIRGGKSYAGILCLLILCRLFPGSRWAIVRKDLETIKRNTLKDFFEIMPKERLKQAPSQHNSWTAIISNGKKPDSEIVFFGENYDKDKDLNRWRGLAVNGFLLEECNEIREESYNKAIERMASWKIDQTWSLGDDMPQVYPSIVLMTCNPAQNWVKDNIYNGWKTNSLPEIVQYIQARATDNPHISKDWFDTKRELMPPLQYQMFVDGDWDITFNDRPFMFSFDYDKHVYRGKLTDLINPKAPLYISCDQNVEPPVITFYQYGRGWMHQVGESDLKTGSVYDLANIIKAQWPGFQYYITGDASGRARSVTAQGNSSFYEILCRELEVNFDYALLAPTSNARHEDSRMLCNTVLHSHPQLLIHESCKHTVSDLQNARVDKTGQLEKDRKDPSKFLDHFDTFRYAIATFFPEYLELPQKYW